MVSTFDEVSLSLRLFIFLNPSHVYRFVLAYFETFLLGVFAKLQKATFSFVISLSLSLSLCACARTCAQGTARIPMDGFSLILKQTWNFSKSIEKIPCLIKI